MKYLSLNQIDRLAGCLVPFAASKLTANVPNWVAMPLPQQESIIAAAAKLLLTCPTVQRNAQLWTHHRNTVLTVLGRWGKADEVDGLLVRFEPTNDEEFDAATDFGQTEKRSGGYNIIPAELHRLGTILAEIESESDSETDAKAEPPKEESLQTLGLSRTVTGEELEKMGLRAGTQGMSIREFTDEEGEEQWLRGEIRDVVQCAIVDAVKRISPNYKIISEEIQPQVETAIDRAFATINRAKRRH